MVFEIAEIDVIAGQEADFEQAVAEASQYFQAAKGYNSLELNRSVENTSRYRLVVGWDTVEDHMVTFRESDSFQQWRKLASPFFAEAPRVEHVHTVFQAND